MMPFVLFWPFKTFGGSHCTKGSLKYLKLGSYGFFLQKCFLQKDYLNHRWLARKAYYAAVLAHTLLTQDTDDMYNVEYSCPNDNPLDVCLLVNVKGIYL